MKVIAFDLVGVLVREIPFNLNEMKDVNLLQNVKNKYPDVRIVIATNHVTYIKKYIENNFDMSLIDDIVTSSDINRVKPNKDFYEYILNKMNIKSSEMLFLDDNLENVIGAEKIGIKAIKVNKDTDILSEIEKVMENK